MRLTNWSARQGGGKISVSGSTLQGKRETITGCTSIDQKERWHYERRWAFGRLQRVVTIEVVAYHPTRGVIHLS